MAVATALGGCSATGQLVNPFADGKIDTAAVQNAAVAACGFLPTAASVASIISAAAGGAGGVVLTTAGQVAAAICQAVVPVRQAGKLGAALPTVNGVVVHGKFVR
jgi:hypothetical protein